MSKPDFFANLDVVNCLLGMQYERTALPAMDLTMDVLELPFWFSLKNDEKSRTLKLYTQMELYTKKEEMAVSKGPVVLDDVSGNAKVSAPPGIGEHMAFPEVGVESCLLGLWIITLIHYDECPLRFFHL